MGCCRAIYSRIAPIFSQKIIFKKKFCSNFVLTLVDTLENKPSRFFYVSLLYIRITSRKIFSIYNLISNGLETPHPSNNYQMKWFFVQFVTRDNYSLIIIKTVELYILTWFKVDPNPSKMKDAWNVFSSWLNIIIYIFFHKICIDTSPAKIVAEVGKTWENR